MTVIDVNSLVQPGYYGDEDSMWLAMSDLPAEGRRLTFDDPAIWTVPLQEFGIPCRILVPLEAELFVVPHHGDGVDGCFIRGTLRGEVSLPCNRCAEDARIVINSDFETFEPFPVEHDAERASQQERLSSDDVPDEEVVRIKDGVAQFNPQALLWEEFSLALPVKPLCRPDCKGLCPVCGHNRNKGDCSCATEEGDPRLAALKLFTPTRKQ